MISPEMKLFANHLADISAPIAKKYFRTANGEFAKADDSPVTKADREIEQIIRQEIEKKFPDHGILGEEFGAKNVESDWVWIVDPIDGTSSFIIGRPIFGTLIALTYKKKPVLGVMNQPITGERWFGTAKDISTFSNFSQFQGHGQNHSQSHDQKIFTRNCVEVSEAVMCSSSSFYFKNGDEEILKKISGLTKYQKIGGIIYGGDCYSYACLASGLVDIVIDCGLKVYDYAALIPIIEGAGGVISDWQGKDLGLKSEVNVLASANKKLHEKLLKILEI